VSPPPLCRDPDFNPQCNTLWNKVIRSEKDPNHPAASACRSVYTYFSFFFSTKLAPDLTHCPLKASQRIVLHRIPPLTCSSMRRASLSEVFRPDISSSPPVVFVFYSPESTRSRERALRYPPIFPLISVDRPHNRSFAARDNSCSQVFIGIYLSGPSLTPFPPSWCPLFWVFCGRRLRSLFLCHGDLLFNCTGSLRPAEAFSVARCASLCCSPFIVRELFTKARSPCRLDVFASTR